MYWSPNRPFQTIDLRSVSNLIRIGSVLVSVKFQQRYKQLRFHASSARNQLFCYTCNFQSGYCAIVFLHCNVLHMDQSKTRRGASGCVECGWVARTFKMDLKIIRRHSHYGLWSQIENYQSTSRAVLVSTRIKPQSGSTPHWKVVPVG